MGDRKSIVGKNHRYCSRTDEGKKES